MVENENDNDSILIINNLKNETFRENLENMPPIISKNREEKSNIFRKAVKKFKNDENYAFYHPLIERHFLFKVVEKMNEELTKNNKGFLYDFTCSLHHFFNFQTAIYCESKGYINKNSKINEKLSKADCYLLDLMIKENTNDKNFIPFAYKLETDLPVIYIYISTWVLLINTKYFKFLYKIIMTSAYLAISFLKQTPLTEKQLRIFLS